MDDELAALHDPDAAASASTAPSSAGSPSRSARGRSSACPAMSAAGRAADPAGRRRRDGAARAALPADWIVNLQVSDVDLTVEVVTAQGGKAIAPPFDSRASGTP